MKVAKEISPSPFYMGQGSALRAHSEPHTVRACGQKNRIRFRNEDTGVEES